MSTVVDVSTRLTASVEAPTSSVCVSGGELTVAGVFRALDLLRRRTARSSRGQQGAFAGFDAIDVAGWQEGAEGKPILFQARLVAQDARTQTVSFTAMACRHADGECRQQGEGPTLVHARGKTVGLPAAVQSRASARRFAIASPHR